MKRKVKSIIFIIIESFLFLSFVITLSLFLDEYNKSLIITDKVQCWFLISFSLILAFFIFTVIIALLSFKKSLSEEELLISRKRKVYINISITLLGCFIAIITISIQIFFSINGINNPFEKIQWLLFGLGLITLIIGTLLLVSTLNPKKLKRNKQNIEVIWKE